MTTTMSGTELSAKIAALTTTELHAEIAKTEALIREHNANNLHTLAHAYRVRVILLRNELRDRAAA